MLEVSNIEVTQNQTHSNKMTWTGVITRLGKPSDGSPCGAFGKSFIIEPSAAEQALDTIINMPLNCEYGDDFWGCCPEDVMTGHDLRFVIGSISSAKIEDDALVCSGIIWKQNFPDVAYLINNAVESLGFSIELNLNKYIEDDTTLTATDVTFTGAAVLWKKCAAFESTEFKQLVASRNKQNKKDDVNMEFSKEDMQALLGEFMNTINASIAEVKTSVEQKVESVVAEVKAEVDKANGEIATLAVSLAETKEEIKATKSEPVVDPDPTTVSASTEPAPVAPAPTVLAAGQSVVANSDFKQTEEYKQKVTEINASNMSMMEKLKAIGNLKKEEK
jgi:hypothetical protein